MTTTSHYVRLWPHRTFLGLVGMSAGAIQELLKILFGKITKFVRDGKGEASGSTTIKPSGLATCEAIFARCWGRAPPIEIGRPTSTRTRRRTAAADRLPTCCGTCRKNSIGPKAQTPLLLQRRTRAPSGIGPFRLKCGNQIPARFKHSPH